MIVYKENQQHISHKDYKFASINDAAFDRSTHASEELDHNGMGLANDEPEKYADREIEIGSGPSHPV